MKFDMFQLYSGMKPVNYKREEGNMPLRQVHCPNCKKGIATYKPVGVEFIIKEDKLFIIRLSQKRNTFGMMQWLKNIDVPFNWSCNNCGTCLVEYTNIDDIVLYKKPIEETIKERFQNDA